MPDSSHRVQNPLNLVLPVRPGHFTALMALLQAADGSGIVRTAMNGLANVHFAQFVPLENNTRLGVFTIYDGDFDSYILSFVEHIGPIFNAILAHVEGGSAVTPVEEHADAFLDFINAHNHASVGLFSAYPMQRVFDIQDALPEQAHE